MDRQLVPIGRFSTMTRLSVKALRYYDRIGLLSPAYVDPATDYRYYGLGQANQAEAIRVLRLVDMPLEEIAEVLEAFDRPDAVGKVLDGHRGRLEDELARHAEMLTFLQQLITGEERIMPYEIGLETVPERTIASLRFTTTLEEIGERFGPAFGRIVGALASAGVAIEGAPLTIYHDVIDDESEGDIEVGLPCAPSFRGDGEVVASSLDGGEVAVTVHRGPYQQIGPAYHALTSWIVDRGHEPAGPPREIYLNDPNEVPEAELRTRVEWPVR